MKNMYGKTLESHCTNLQSVLSTKDQSDLNATELHQELNAVSRMDETS